MSDELTWEAVLAWRVGRQGLAERAPAEDWPAVVARICGLHAQVQTSAELTLWARVEGLDRDAVAQALALGVRHEQRGGGRRSRRHPHRAGG